MAKANFEWDYDAAGELLLRSPEIAEFCEAEAARMTRATGVKYVKDVYVGRTRVNAGAYTKGDLGDDTEGAGDDSKRGGREVHGYNRKGKDGKMIYVKAYRRTK